MEPDIFMITAIIGIVPAVMLLFLYYTMKPSDTPRKDLIFIIFTIAFMQFNILNMYLKLGDPQYITVLYAIMSVMFALIIVFVHRMRKQGGSVV